MDDDKDRPKSGPQTVDIKFLRSVTGYCLLERKKWIYW